MVEQRAGASAPASIVGRRRHEQRRLVAEHEPHATVAGAERARAHPHDLAGRAQRVEIGGPVLGQARRQHVGLEHRRRDRRARQHAEHVDDAVDAAPVRADAVPRRQEAGERAAVDGLDLLAQRRERAAAQLAQHVVVAPLALDAVGPELAAHDAAVGFERFERRQHPVGADAEVRGHVRGEERAVGAGVAGDEVEQRMRRPDR